MYMRQNFKFYETVKNIHADMRIVILRKHALNILSTVLSLRIVEFTLNLGINNLLCLFKTHLICRYRGGVLL